MSADSTSRQANGRPDAASGALLVVVFLLATPLLLSAQVHGVPSSGYGHRPGAAPAHYGVYPTRSGYGHGHGSAYGYNGYAHRNAYGYNGYGGVYAVPYYVPIYGSSYGYDSGGGEPYDYSGPPAEQTLPIVVDSAPPRRDAFADDEDADASALGLPPAPGRKRDARPVEPVVLVFRDGHQQEVTNYAIMGQTVYVFDHRTQKIAVGDLDLPATIKANDDRGVEFQLPGPKPS